MGSAGAEAQAQTAALWGAGKGSGQCHSCSRSSCYALDAEEKLLGRGPSGAEGKGSESIKKDSVWREATRPPPGSTLTEGSEVLERRALTGLQPLTFVFSVPSQRLYDSSLPNEGPGVTMSDSEPVFLV